MTAFSPVFAVARRPMPWIALPGPSSGRVYPIDTPYRSPGAPTVAVKFLGDPPAMIFPGATSRNGGSNVVILNVIGGSDGSLSRDVM